MELRKKPRMEDWYEARRQAGQAHPLPIGNEEVIDTEVAIKLILQHKLDVDGIAVEALWDQGFYTRRAYNLIAEGIENAAQVLDRRWNQSSDLIGYTINDIRSSYLRYTGEFNNG